MAFLANSSTSRLAPVMALLQPSLAVQLQMRCLRVPLTTPQL